jgi:hypothetical protein
MSSNWSYCSKLTSFPQIDISNVTSISTNWAYCSSLTTFPELDYSNITNLHNTWYACNKLECMSGTLDFRNVTNNINTFIYCSNLINPASTGTTVRDGDDALSGIWTNPDTCP